MVSRPDRPTQIRVQVGSILAITGGGALTGGSWPGPPVIGNRQIVALISNHAVGAEGGPLLRATGAGVTTVTMDFEPGPDVCSPNPCTAGPGGPLVLSVTVRAAPSTS